MGAVGERWEEVREEWVEEGPERKLTRFMDWPGSSYCLVVSASVFIVTIY